MVIDGVEIAKRQFLSGDKLSVVISELNKEFKDKIQRKEPKFYLINVPSAINTFESLMGRRNEDRVV